MDYWEETSYQSHSYFLLYNKLPPNLAPYNNRSTRFTQSLQGREWFCWVVCNEEGCHSENGIWRLSWDWRISFQAHSCGYGQTSFPCSQIEWRLSSLPHGLAHRAAQDMAACYHQSRDPRERRGETERERGPSQGGSHSLFKTSSWKWHPIISDIPGEGSLIRSW